MGNSTSKVDLNDAPASTSPTVGISYNNQRNLSRQSLSGSGSGAESPFEPGSITRPSSSHSSRQEQGQDLQDEDRPGGRRLSNLSSHLQDFDRHDDGNQNTAHPPSAPDQDSAQLDQQQQVRHACGPPISATQTWVPNAHR